MSYFLHNEGCPRCMARGDDTSRDNLAVYSDGHKYCYKCKYFVSGDPISRFKVKPKDNELVYPADEEFTKECLTYLKQYGLTNDEIETYLEGHADGYMFKDSNFFLIRRLHKKPKVLIHGNVVGNEPVFINENVRDTVVLCEDILSAIKLARYSSVCALLKTSIHDVLLYRLAMQFDNCVLWLDPDMYIHMTTKLLPLVKPYFKSVKIVISTKDPKAHDDREIKEYLNV